MIILLIYLLIIAIIIVTIYSSYYENFTNTTTANDALQSISSVFNNGNMTIGNLHTTGNITTDGTINTQTINSQNITVNGQYNSAGGAAGYIFNDRSQGDRWMIYATDNSARIWTEKGGGDRLTIDQIGNITASGNINSFGNITASGNINSTGLRIGNTTIQSDGTITKIMPNSSCGSNVNFGGNGFSAGPYETPTDCYNYCKKTFPPDGSNSGQIARCATYNNSTKQCWCCQWQAQNANNQYIPNQTAIYEV